MTIAVVAVSGLTAGTTTAAAWPALPTGSAAGHALLAAFACKPYTADVSSGSFLTDYTLVGNTTNGTVANGVDVGSVRCHVRYREMQTGDVAPSGTVSAAPSPRMTGMLALSRGGTSWDVAGTTGGDTDATGTSVSITGAADPGVASGDHVVVYVAMPSDGGNPPSVATITVPGCTVGTVTRQGATRITTSGNDGSLVAYEAPITAGTSTGAPSISFTAGTSGFSSAAAVFVRLREVSTTTHLGEGTITVTPTLSGAGLLLPAIGAGTLTVTPTLSGAGIKIATGTANLTVTPTLSGTGSRDPRLGAGSLTVTPVLSGDGSVTGGAVLADGTLTVTPTVAGTGYATLKAAATVTVTPVLTGDASVADAVWMGSGMLTVVPALTGDASVTLAGSRGTLTVTPVLYVYATVTPAGGFIMSAAQIADAIAQWPDARNMDAGVLTNLLESAWTACETFLPTAITTDAAYVPADVPAYVQANVLHARDLFQATRRDTGDVVGFDSFAIRVRPLSSTVKALLRPSTGRALVG